MAKKGEEGGGKRGESISMIATPFVARMNDAVGEGRGGEGRGERDFLLVFTLLGAIKIQTWASRIIRVDFFLFQRAPCSAFSFSSYISPFPPLKMVIYFQMLSGDNGTSWQIGNS